jgi:hypothetical protein
MGGPIANPLICSLFQGCTGRHWHKRYSTLERFSAMAGQLNIWSAPHSPCSVPLTPRNGIGWFLVVASVSLPGSRTCVIYFVGSFADTSHVGLLCCTFWNIFFATGNAAEFSVHLILRWSVSLSPNFLNTKNQVVCRQLIVKLAHLFLP